METNRMEEIYLDLLIMSVGVKVRPVSKKHSIDKTIVYVERGQSSKDVREVMSMDDYYCEIERGVLGKRTPNLESETGFLGEESKPHQGKTDEETKTEQQLADHSYQQEEQKNTREIVDHKYKQVKLPQKVAKTEKSKDEIDTIEQSSLLTRDTVTGKETYARIMTCDKGLKHYIALITTDKKENVSNKVSLHKSSTHKLDNLMIVNPADEEGLYFFTQRERKPDGSLDKSIELVCLCRASQRYKVTIRTLASVNEHPTIFQLANTRRSMVVYIPQTTIGLFYNLRGHDLLHRMKELCISLPIKHERFNRPLVKLCLEEQKFSTEILSGDILYLALAFADGQVFIKLISKSEKRELKEYQSPTDFAPLATLQGDEKVTLKNMFFKPSFNMLVLVSENEAGDVFMEVFGMTFESDGINIKFYPNKAYYFISRKKELGIPQNKKLTYKVNYMEIDRSLELLILPENMKSTSIYKIKFNRATNEFSHLQADSFKIEFKGRANVRSAGLPYFPASLGFHTNLNQRNNMDRENNTDDEFNGGPEQEGLFIDDGLSVRAQASLNLNANPFLEDAGLFSEAGVRTTSYLMSQMMLQQRAAIQSTGLKTVAKQSEDSVYRSNQDYADFVPNTHTFTCIEEQCMILLTK